MIKHLKESHDKEILTTTHSFKNKEAFNVRKKEQEKLSSSLYVQDSGGKKHGSTLQKYFFCHQSGFFTLKEKGQRALKKLSLFVLHT